MPNPTNDPTNAPQDDVTDDSPDDSTTQPAQAPASAGQPGVLLERLTWQEAERVLTSDAIVVIPLGAAAKEHGPHMQLRTDWLLAEFLKNQVLQRAEVIVAPTIGTHYFPAFREYPGSVTLRLETARDLIVDVIDSLAAFGPRRFYVLNTGISTIKALRPAVELLRARGLLVEYTDLREADGRVPADTFTQEGGTHADERETSMMLVIGPDTVNMSKAVKDYDPRPLPGLTRQGPDVGKTYSPSGIFGDPTLATRDKGEHMIRAMMSVILDDIARLRATAVPPETSPATSPATSPGS